MLFRRPAVRRRRRLVLAAVAFLTAALALIPRAGTLLVVTHEVSEPQAIVVLGSHEWERLPAAARLAARNPDAAVLLTDPTHPNVHNCFRCSERTAWLESLGVSAARVAVLPRKVTNTYDEATAVHDYVMQHHDARVMIVTSPYHTARALATFAKVFAGSDVAIGVIPSSDESPARPGRWWANGYDRAYVGYEWAARVWYALRHGVAP
jgi:uncharacterized SAM-binding protein YcdF (DUF218 family)